MHGYVIQNLFFLVGYGWKGVRGSLAIQSLLPSRRDRERVTSKVIQREHWGRAGYSHSP